MSTTLPANLLNSTPFDVVYLDGKTETLQLGRLSIRNLYTWINLLVGDRLPELVALTVGRPVEWVDTLTDQSFGELSAKCVALNFQRAMDLGKTDPTIAVKLVPLLSQFAAVLRSPSAGAMSSVPSAEPAPSASPAATGSESLTTPPPASSPSSPSTPA